MTDESRDAYRLKQAETAIRDLRTQLKELHEEMDARVDVVEDYKEKSEEREKKKDRKLEQLRNGVILLCVSMVSGIGVALFSGGHL